MAEAEETHLSKLATRWSLLAKAHAPDEMAAREARAAFLPQYCTPVYRYLLGIAGDPDIAEELAQEFALRFVRGDFRFARPELGRFRDYLKAGLRHLVSEWRRRPAPPDSLPSESRLPPLGDDDDEAAFVACWRGELLDRTWRLLERESAATGTMQYEALRLKADEPSRNSAAVAALLAEAYGRPFSADAARQLLHRAREKYAALLRTEVADSLGVEDAGAIDEELADLGLLVYQQPA